MSEIPLASQSASGPTAPVEPSGRIESLDVLRGFAVLGILVMNIQSFSMPDPAYFNPTVWGDLTGVNFLVWLSSHLLADSKFITLFSLLYGAGIVLLSGRVEQRNASPAGLHYRRTFWLLLFGLTHAYLMWQGDVLVWYSLSAAIAYLFWRVRPVWLIFWSVLLLTIGTSIYVLAQWSLPYWPDDAVAGNLEYWQPPEALLAERLEAFRGGWLDQMSQRVPASLMLHTFVYLIFGLWKVVGLFLLGMALFKWGVLSAERSTRFYVIAAVLGLSLGLALTGFGAYQNLIHGFSFEFSLFGGTLFNYWGSLIVAVAYVSIIMLMCKRTGMTRLNKWLGATGRMAFTSYILQTIICTTIFYGHGFGFFGYVPRWGQLAITVGVWIVVVAFAKFWLSRFRLGPLEWLWRSLTYSRLQPMKLISK